MILPQRNPLVLAKQVASLDVLSDGRLLLGVGVEFLEPELAALGVAMSERGARTDEYLDAMHALWTQPRPAYQGRVCGVREPRRASSAGATGRAADRDRRSQPPARLGRLEINFMQLDPVAVDADAARHYADLGVDRLVLYPLPLEDPAEVAEFLKRYADLPH